VHLIADAPRSAAEFVEGLPEVVEDFGVAGAEAVGLLQQVEGVFVAALLEIDPAEGIEERGVFGIEIEGGLDVAEGFVEPFAADGPEIGEVVEGFGVVGIEPDGGFELFDGEVGLFGLVEATPYQKWNRGVRTSDCRGSD